MISRQRPGGARRAASLSAAVAIETLELRRLLAASVSNGVLVVDGTSAADVITLSGTGEFTATSS
jgi:hypothetical protein